MSFVENTNYLANKQSDEQGDPFSINQSSELNEIAEKLIGRVLEDTCECYIPKETKEKARIVDNISSITATFRLIKRANNRPVFLVMNHYSVEGTDGFFFFIGTQQEIKAKLIKLCQEQFNLKKNQW